MARKAIFITGRGSGIGRATALAFARCLGEFGATLAFAGSLQGVTRTMPLEIYLQREVTPDAALALSVVLVVVAAVVVLATGGRGTGLRRAAARPAAEAPGRGPADAPAGARGTGGGPADALPGTTGPPR